MRSQSSLQHPDNFPVQLLVRSNRLRETTSSPCDTLNKRMRCGIADSQTEKSNWIFGCRLVDELEQSFLIPDAAICEQQYFRIQILEAILHRGQNRLIHLSSPHIGTDIVGIVQGGFEAQCIITLALSPHERVS